MKFLKISIILLILVGSAVGVMMLKNGEAAIEIDHSTVVNGPLTFSVETLGTLEPLTDVVVSCEATGKIVEILRDYDDPVKADEIICRIDPEFVAAQHAGCHWSACPPVHRARRNLSNIS
jgi:HlyD family secretion protein